MQANALILGWGLSGKAAAGLLQRQDPKTNIFVYDQKTKAEGFCSVCDDGLTDSFLKSLSICIISPSFAIDSPLIKRLRACGVPLKGEIELGAQFCKAPIIATTGTNGKSTTTALISEILNYAGKSCYALGNIGNAFCEKADLLSEINFVSLEVSSFQLESTKSFCPKIALVLNISPDHLDRHYTMQNYARQKMRIAKNQTENDFLILNADDVEIGFFNKQNIAAQTFFVSLRSKVRGVYIEDGFITFEGERIINADDIKLLGLHNLYNSMFAVGAAKLVGIENQKIANVLATFKGISHRLEFVKEFGGQKFYNDSKGTNISSTLKAVNALKGDIALILGGSDKGYEYDELFEKLPFCVKFIAVIGETTQKILQAAKRNQYDWGKILACNSLESALCACVDSGQQNVLLSPASASFDMFQNFEHRGEVFCELVKKIAR